MKKLLSILLVVVMILALAVPAVAAGDEDFTNPNLMGHAQNMTYYEGGYGAVPSRYQCMINEGETGYAEWFPIVFGDPVVENWPTEVGTHTVHFIVTTSVEGAGDTEYTFPFSMNITVLELPATSGQCGENMYWEFDTATDTLTISGTGDMYTIAEDNESFWNEQYGYEPGWWYLPVRHIVVKEGVENLSNYAFFQNWNGYYAILETLELPTSLRAIPEQGMVCSTAMKKLVIPEGITSLTGWPFGSPGNSFLGLQEIYLPSTLKEFDPLTLVFSGLDSRKGTITMQSIHYAGSQEQWDGIARVESAYLNEMLGENSDFFRESFVGPIDEILAGFVVPEGCNHTWKDATCDKPKTCTSCGATTGKPSGEHTYTNGVCIHCGAEQITRFRIATMRMQLKNELQADFAFVASNLPDWTGCYAIVTQQLENGTRTTTISSSQWYTEGAYVAIPYTNMAAKEMTDALTIVLYNADGQAISDSYTSRLAEYAVRAFDLAANKGDTEAMDMYVSMLYYGAAAQEAFGYKKSNKATDYLSDAMIRFVNTTGRTIVDLSETNTNVEGSVGAEYGMGSRAVLESNIQLQLAFQPEFYNAGYTATYSYVNHLGETVKGDLPIKAITDNEGNVTRTIVTVEDLVIADCGALVTIRFYNKSGARVIKVFDSVEHFAVRMNESTTAKEAQKVLAQEIMNFSTSAYNYFH